MSLSGLAPTENTLRFSPPVAPDRAVPANTSNTPLPSWTWQEVAMGVVIVAGCILAFAAITAGAGSLMKMGGERLIADWTGTGDVLETVGKVLVYAGEKLFQLGRYAFLTVAVPVYTVVWVIPKWIVTEGIPQVAAFVHEYVLIPICDGLMKVATFLQDILVKVAEVAYDHIIKPFGEWIIKVATWVWDVVIVRFAEYIQDFCIMAIEKIFKHILEPLGRTIIEVSLWTWRIILVPLAEHIVTAAMFTKDLIVTIALKIYEWVLQPFGNAIIAFSQWIWNVAIIHIVEAAQFVKDILVIGAEKIYEYILGPLVDAVVTASRWIWSTAILPIAEKIYFYVILPTGQFLVQAFNLTCEYGGALLSSAIDITQSMAHSVYETFDTLIQSISGPPVPAKIT